MVFHCTAVTPDDAPAVHVHESREAADPLTNEKIAPLAADLGLDMPEIADYPVHARRSWPEVSKSHGNTPNLSRRELHVSRHL